MTDKHLDKKSELHNLALYRAQATEVPPRHIDDDILSMARRQAKLNSAGADDSVSDKRSVRQSKGEYWRSRIWPISTAASVLVLVGVLLINDQTLHNVDLSSDDDLPTPSLLQADVADIEQAEASSNAGEPQMMSVETGEPNRFATPSLAKRAVPMASGLKAESAQSTSELYKGQANRVLSDRLAQEQFGIDKLILMLTQALDEKRLFDAKLIEQHIQHRFLGTQELNQLQIQKLKTLRQTLVEAEKVGQQVITPQELKKHTKEEKN